MAAERVFVVDDEESTAVLLQRILAREGYQVSVANSVTGAKQLLEQEPFAVGIVDLRLPDGEGLDVLRCAKELHPASEVIILTGYADVESAVEALRLGAFDYQQKPIQDLRLIAISVARALERQQLTQRNVQLLADLQAANAELQMRRRHALQYISHIGQALGGALHHREVGQVLIRAVLDSTECDGAGLIWLPRECDGDPYALLGGRRPLPPSSQRALVESLVGALPSALQPDPMSVAASALAPAEAGEPDREPWGHFEFGLLAFHDDISGVAVMGRHAAEPFTDEARGIFDILVTQGGTALANARLFERANELATRDGLTGLYNHRHFFELLEAEINRTRRYNLRFAVIMLDMDRGATTGLKAVNDRFGHQAGDEMLCGFAHFLQRNVRRADMVARYGGDEFVVLAPQTDREEALALAHRICEQIRDATFTAAGHDIHLTVSVGAAVFEPQPGYDAMRVVSMADRGTYAAKDAGGDQWCLIEGDGTLVRGN